MKCKDKDIKEMLPAYLEEGLERAEKARVEKHLETCEDCKGELALLRMMAAEPVPDPGEAFWQAMPERIYREARKQKQEQRRRGFDLSDFLKRLFAPRWAWAAAAVGLVAVVSWLLIRPAPVEIAVTAPPGEEAPYEDVLSPEPVDVAELTPNELDAAAEWAGAELASIGEAAGEEMVSSRERDIYEDIAELNPQELEQLYKMLETGEYGIQKKLRSEMEIEEDLV